MRSLRTALLFCSPGIETAIYGFDEHIGCPGGIPGEAGVIVSSEFGRFDLRKRHATLDHFLDAISNDGHHIPVIRHVSGIGDAPMSRNDQGAAFYHF